MTKEEKIELQQVIERKIKVTELAITDYKEMTQPVAPEKFYWQIKSHGCYQ